MLMLMACKAGAKYMNNYGNDTDRRRIKADIAR